MPAPLRFQHFEVLTRSDGSPHLLGKGAMGLTYRAFDRNLLSLAVIKVIAPQYAQHPAARQRFLQEAQSMAKIKHPNVADVFFLGDSTQGPFYAMEFCDGPSVQDFVEEKGALEAGDALSIALQAASALQAVEQASLIHRDIKPSNLLLVNDAQGRTGLKMIDFGLARDVIREGGANLSQGGFVGTPTFASPEQLLEQEHLDIRSDIYSLGITLWFMLSGRPPFSGSQFEVMFHHVNTPPPWDRLPSMPDGARDVLRRMIEKSPDDRFQSPAELYRELQAAMLETGATAEFGARLSIGPREKDGSVLGMSAFEILAEAGSDQTGKTFRARDTHSGQLVALKYLNAEVCEKPGLLNRIQRHVLALRPLDHPNLVSVLGFEKGDDGAKVATEWVRGPSLLTLLKSRNELALREAAPLLGQLASVFDFATARGITTLESDLHQIVITSTELGDDSAQWTRALRGANGSWADAAVKINPLRLSLAPGDYPTIPDPSAAPGSDPGSSSTAGPRPLLATFLGLVHRLLGGAGGSHASSHAGYVSIPHLGAEANDLLESFFTPPFTAEKKNTSCADVLRSLCRAERVPEPEIFVPPADVDAESMMTRDSSLELPPGTVPGITVAPGTGARPPSVPGSTPALPVGGPATHHGTRFPSTAGSHAGRPGTRYGSSSMGSSAGKITADYEIKRKELELQRARLEAEADRLQQEEVLEQTRAVLEEERAALAAAKDEFARLERERAARAEQERQRLESERASLEAQTSDLESKRLEQDRLEQEIKLRAQLEFQKFQDEKRKREEEWQRQREEIERALREREEQYLLREQQSFRKLQEERARLESLAAEIEQSKSRAQHDAEAAGRDQLASLEAERQRLADEQAELQRRIIAQSQDHARLRQELENAERDLEERHRAQAAQMAVEAARKQEEIDAERARLAEERTALERHRAALAAEKDAGLGATLLAAEEREQNENALARLAEAESRLARERETIEAEARTRAQQLEQGLERQRLELEEERRQLALEVERARSASSAELDQERLKLEAQRRELADQEAQLVTVLNEKGREFEQQMAAQKAEIEAERQSLAQRRAALDVEHERLTADVQRERENFRRELDEQRAREEAEAAERARERAAELGRLESEQQKKLDALREEISREEERLAQQKSEVFSQERLQVRMDQEAGFQNQAEIDGFDAEQKRLEVERQALDAKITEFQAVQRAAQRRRLVTIAAGLVLLLTAGGVGAYFSRGFIGELIRPGYKLWTTYESEVAQKEAAADWSGVMKLVAGADADFRKDPKFSEFYAAHQAQLHEKAATAAQRLLSEFEAGRPVPEGEAAEALLHEIQSVEPWLPPAQARLLSAMIGMPLHSGRGNHAETLRLYLAAATADPATLPRLQKQFEAAVAALIEAVRADQPLADKPAVTAALNQLPPSARETTPRLSLLAALMNSESAREAGRLSTALQALVDVSSNKADWSAEVRPEATALVDAIQARPPEEIRAASQTLIAAGHEWKLEKPFMMLAEAEPETRQKYDFYQEAANFGNIEAKAELGGYHFFSGVRLSDDEAMTKGLALLREAADAGQPKGLYLLASAYFEGQGVPENANEATRLAALAVEKGHGQALVLLGNSQLRLAELTPSVPAYQKATETLTRAAAQGFPEAWYTLYISYWNATVQNAPQAVDALRAGAQAQDRNCLFALGEWYLKGQPPLTQNISLARDAIAKAARLGHARAIQWCRAYERQMRSGGTAADKQWVSENSDAWGRE